MIAAISHRFAINSHAYAMCVVNETKQLLVAAVADYNDKVIRHKGSKRDTTRMWANTQRDGRPAEHMWRPLVNAAKFG